MITTQQNDLYHWLKKGIEQSKKDACPKLISLVQRVVGIDPFTYFSNGRSSFIGERIFWSDANGQFYIVGLGHSLTIEADAYERFYQMKSMWQELIKQAEITNTDSDLQAVGPVLFGGFSFDPLKQKTDLWQGFSDGKMLLPMFMLTMIDDQAWLTINLIVNQNEDVDKKASWLDVKLQQLLTHPPTPAPNKMINKFFRKWDIQPEQWLKTVEKVTKQIQKGQVDKVVFARELLVETDEDILVEEVLMRLHHQQPSSYLFAVEAGEKCFIGASPERLIKKQGEDFYATCLAGSARRGVTIKEDEQLGIELQLDKKNLHEHQLVVQMIKSAMENACIEMTIPDTPALYKARDIQHLYTPIIGKKKPGITLLDMVEQLHPTPALGGFPREKALEIIREEELLDRGWYGAPIGWIDINGDGEFVVAIRSGIIQEKVASLFAGCGIVGDSDPMSEFQETEIKFKPMLSALGG